MVPIEETLNAFLELIKDKEPGKAFSRFKSWEYCHLKFVEAHGKEHLTEEEKDILSLHLSFYLASWGMYRGSSFILQRDYKAHRGIVDIVLKHNYDELWDFDPSTVDESTFRRVAEKAHKAYLDIENHGYGEIPERFILEEPSPEEQQVENQGQNNVAKPISYTLITKILMGTFAITPAFDRFLIDGIKKYNTAHSSALGKGSTYSVEKMVKLFKFAKENAQTLNLANDTTDFPYPLMKKVDMYFWEVGYEAGFIETLKGLKKDLEDKDLINFVDSKKKRMLLKTKHQIKSFITDSLSRQGNDLDVINSFITEIQTRVRP